MQPNPGPRPAAGTRHAVHGKADAEGDRACRLCRRCRSIRTAGQPGRQGTALRPVGRRDLRRGDHGHHLRLGQLHARQPQSAGRADAVDRHVAQLHLRRQGRRPDQPAGLPDRRRVPGRADGGPHAGVPRQEGRGPRDEAGHAGPAHPPDPDPRPDRPVRRAGLGHEGDQQSRRARLLGDPLRVQLGVGEQRLRLRGAAATPGASTTRRRTRRPPARTARPGTSPPAW